MLLLEALAKWVKVCPDKTVFTYLKDDGSERVSITYKELDVRTRAISEHLLVSAGLTKGARVLLVFEPSLQHIVAFIACVRAGIIAVPVFPPHPNKLKKDMAMFVTIAANCGAEVALTSAEYNSNKRLADMRNMFSKDGAKWPELKWIVVDDIPSSLPTIEEDKVSLPTDTCFLQYTSGSTSEPKGVMISHANLAHNLSCIIEELKAGEDTIVVSWLPQYHDMGLIGSYLGCLYCGGSGYYMSPYAFVKQPLLWLQLVSKYRGTHLQAPNFAYALTARRFRSLKKPLSPPLDLSCIRHMINAAEPVMEKDLRAFYDSFRRSGLNDGVVFPTYGLAEHTVLVCSGGAQTLRVDKKALEIDGNVQLVEAKESPALAKETSAAADLAGGAESSDAVARVDDSTATIVGCGYPFRKRVDIAPVEVVIVAVEAVGSDAGGSQELKHLGEDKVGEIWIHSPSKACGYWGNPEKSEEDFGATLAADPEKKYLRTGDLGFLHAEELFICGRLKDLIIIRGRNHYPQDIERCVESTTNQLRPGKSAAFPVQAGSMEHIAVVAELRQHESKAECARIVEGMKVACAREQGVQVGIIYLIKDRTIPITTSGKIARRWCKRSYDEGKFDTIFKWEEQDLQGESTNAITDDSVQCVIQEEIDDDELMQCLLDDIAKIGNYDIEELQDKTDIGLVNLGLDSMTIGDLMKMLEVRYSAPVPEHWLLFESTTIQQILVAVRNGGVPDDVVESADGSHVQKISPPQKQNQLLQTCPCFLMCCPGYVLGRSS